MKRRSFLFCLPAAAADWPSFRGDGTSISTATDLPRDWAPDKNIAWSADIPGAGQSCPVVWKDQVFVTSTSGRQKEDLYLNAYDVKTGSQVWSKRLASPQAAATGLRTPPVSPSPSSGAGALISKAPAALGVPALPSSAAASVGAAYASPTPFAEAGRVFALFETGQLGAFDERGNVLWQRSLSALYGPWTGKHGVATSLRRTQDAVIVFVAQSDKSFLLAADPETGKTDWKVDRPQPAETWSTPVVVYAWQREIIVLCAGGAVEGYSTYDGKLLWRKEGISGTRFVSPIPAGENRVLIASSERGSNLLLRINPPGREPDIVWKSQNVTTGFSSPLIYDGVAYFVSAPGALFALDLETGKELFSDRLSGEHWASPIAWKNRICFFALDGTTTIIESGRKLVKIATNKIPGNGPVYGVAAADDALYFRMPGRLVRVGIPVPPKPKLWTPPKKQS